MLLVDYGASQSNLLCFLARSLDFIKTHFLESLLQFIPCSHKIVPLPDEMDLTTPLLAMNPLSATMNELVSKVFATSICMAQQVKHANSALYLF